MKKYIFCLLVILLRMDVGAYCQQIDSKLEKDGPLQENVDKWRAEDRTSFEPQLKTNGFWLSYINGQLQNDQDLEQINNYNNLVEAIKPEGLKEMAKKYLNGDNYIRLVLMSENIKQL